MTIKDFIFKIKEVTFIYGYNWDLMSPIEKNAKEFANLNINKEPKMFKDENSYEFSSEYILAASSMTINDKLRNNHLDHDIINIFKDINKHKLKKDIVVYRGIHENVIKLMIENAKNYKNIDYYEKGFLNTSIVKGKEIDCNTKLRILLPKGTCAFYVGNVSSEEEIYYEVIIQKGAKLKILSKDKEYINCILIETD
ncbi:ADP-ribosyltransferase [Anaerococcus sp. Marseille-P9784]|uniref:ADP-ribosyltransferase n=1 Tax=Anaerococcus sp. Marseille-P9784 TaxID=2614127 RepID=UPI001788DC2C|nr:ADP-ribosyltransferase [Anaerococcus sp. Marseille-P9784]